MSAGALTGRSDRDDSAGREARAEAIARMRERLSRVAWRRRALRVLAMGLRVAAVVLAAALALLVVDALWPLAGWVRVGVMGVGVGVLVWWGISCGRKFAGLGREASRGAEVEYGVRFNALVNGVSAEGEGTYGEALAGRATEGGEQIAGELKPVPPLAWGEAKSGAWRLLAASALWMVLLLVLPRFVLGGVMRFANPFGDHPPFSLTVFEVSVEPADVVVGDDVTVTVKFGGLMPERARLVQVGRGGEVGNGAAGDRDDAGGMKPGQSGEAIAWAFEPVEKGTYVRRLREVRERITFYVETETGRSRRHVIEPRERTPADLSVVDVLTEGPIESQPGETVMIDVAISNSGETAAPVRVGVEVNRRLMAIVDTETTLASARQVYAVGFRRPDLAGRYRVRLIVDPLEAVNDADRSNNASEVIELNVASPEAGMNTGDAARGAERDLARLRDELRDLMREAAALQQRLDEVGEGEAPAWLRERIDELGERLTKAMREAEAAASKLPNEGKGGSASEALREAIEAARRQLQDMQSRKADATKPGASEKGTGGEGGGGASEQGALDEWLKDVQRAAKADAEAMAETLDKLRKAMREGGSGGGADGSGGKAATDVGEGTHSETGGSGEVEGGGAASMRGVPLAYRDLVANYLRELVRAEAEESRDGDAE